MTSRFRVRIGRLAALTMLLCVAWSAPMSVVAYDCPPNTESVAGVCVASDTGLSKVEVIDIISAILGWITFVFGSIAVMIFVICGLKYLLSAGDENSTRDAKTCMKWAIIGVFVAGGAFTIVKSIGFFLLGKPPVL